MRFRPGARVVLLCRVQSERAGARGVVLRDTGSVAVVRFESGRTMPVSSDLLGLVEVPVG